MENKETDRIVVAKPVASRPSASIVRAIRGPSSNMDPEMGSGLIKPKTVRFKPTVTQAPPPVESSQGDALKPDTRPAVLYKPLPKVVSRTAVSVLANMGNSLIDSVEHRVDKPHSSGTQLSQNVHDPRDLPTRASGDCSTSLPVESGSRNSPLAAILDRPSYDGYNWRKYGQKQVKGSEYPRSYYKCTHPNCQVKKKVERSLDGQIAEIVYKGDHNHPKPQPPKRGSGTGQEMTDPLTNNRAIERKEGSESKAEATNDCAMHRRELTTAGLNHYDSHGPSPEPEPEHLDGATRMAISADEPGSKRRKTKNKQNVVEINGETPEEPQVSLQGSVDPDIRDDGFRWRKYGQKVVKGNPYPRSYYKCTSTDCNVRKHVERALDDPTVFITTYEGKHNHETPVKSMNIPSSELDLQATTASRENPQA